mmetsp:Transcript_118694/g.378442  ORF Transcript_118694/g.378442 Transcript_118694/m.378442 type:complete len:233 (-) Transcript_118694:387-1085(-)
MVGSCRLTGGRVHTELHGRCAADLGAGCEAGEAVGRAEAMGDQCQLDHRFGDDDTQHLPRPERDTHDLAASAPAGEADEAAAGHGCLQGLRHRPPVQGLLRVPAHCHQGDRRGHERLRQTLAEHRVLRALCARDGRLEYRERLSEGQAHVRGQTGCLHHVLGRERLYDHLREIVSTGLRAETTTFRWSSSRASSRRSSATASSSSGTPPATSRRTPRRPAPRRWRSSGRSWP